MSLFLSLSANICIYVAQRNKMIELIMKRETNSLLY